jgi:hypothetical protein
MSSSQVRRRHKPGEVVSDHVENVKGKVAFDPSQLPKPTPSLTHVVFILFLLSSMLSAFLNPIGDCDEVRLC